MTRWLTPDFARAALAAVLKPSRLLLFAVGAALFLVYAPGLMVPFFALFAISVVNQAIAVCYFVVPDLLDEKSSDIGFTFLNPNAEQFGRFIYSCGAHHVLHPGAMAMMMNGAQHGNPLVTWTGWFIMLAIDVVTTWASAVAARDFQREMLRRQAGAAELIAGPRDG